MKAADVRRHVAAHASSQQGRIAARLAGIEGIGRAQAPEEARTLASLLAEGPLPVDELLALATQLARTLGAMHARGVLHLDIHPAHVLLHGPQRVPLLVGLHLATTFAEERPGFTHHSEIRGHLTYLSPEQTGRTGRSVDARADLYSVGATLYEAATGRPPFESGDPLQLLHDHLVRAPVPPRRVRPQLPDVLSRIILRLLEKEPERRYQSASGLEHDLVLARREIAAGGDGPESLGERDFPPRLAAPSRLVGRAAETALLHRALDEAIEGRGRAVLVSGAPGVGKTSLINELRPMVTARRGWFVSGKFDQYRQEAPTATVQALRALGRLLLAEPEAQLAASRERILRALGANARLVCTLPEYDLLLGPQPEVPAAEPSQAEARLVATFAQLVRAIASPERPLVMVLDDLQWAGGISVRFLDAMLYLPGLQGLLLVGSYRDSEVDATHPVGAAMERWQRLERVPHALHLANLPGEGLREMLQQMLRLPQQQAEQLARPVAEHTGGNPYDTVELLNALRREGALRPAAAGWEWDAAPLRRYVGQRGVVDLLAARIRRLPPAGFALVLAMACLGGQVGARVLGAAAGLLPDALDEALAAPLEDGLLVVEPGGNGVLRMRHDRVQQAAYSLLDAARRCELHREIALRLEAAGMGALAVEHYVPAEPAIADPQEARHVAALLGETAGRVKTAANFAVVERLAAAALRLLARVPDPSAADEALRASLEVEHHLSLCSLGRLDEADALYAAIVARGAPVETWVDAACAQVVSLHNRTRPREAVALALPLLRELGLSVPEDFEKADLELRLRELAAWVGQVQVGKDDRPYTGDARATATARLVNRLAYPAYFSDIRVMAWLMAEAQALWERHGPSPDLVHALAHMGGVTIGINQDFRCAYDGIAHVVGVSESRGWELSTAEARFLLCGHARPWFEPLERVVRHLYIARESLQRNGQLHAVSFTYRSTTTAMLDCEPTLRGWGAELRSALALVLRLHNEYLIALMASDLQVLHALAGDDAGIPIPPEALECLARQAAEPPMSLSIHFREALLAALFGEPAQLAVHTSEAMKFVRFTSNYRAAQVRALHALGLAHRLRGAPAAERGGLLAGIDELVAWMRARAADAPANFLHLAAWMQAERAWACGEFREAASAFDEALALLDGVVRPWHRGLVAQRCGLFQLEQGMARAGRQSLSQARHAFAEWGAARKVARLEAEHPFLRDARDADPTQPPSRAAAAVDTLDTLAILRASQALSSETSLTRLEARVGDLMRALTGATGVQLVLRDARLADWLLPASARGPGAAGGGAERVTLSSPLAAGLLPLAPFRYAERTREPLLVEDAVSDDRFARDPYFAGLAACSLLIVPILSQGTPRAMLVLENRASRGAFGTQRLESVKLIAGQLAVSVDNALLYDSLEQRVRDQTRELVATARRAGMAQVATNVLHNVGNVLNSVNVSARSLSASLAQSRQSRVGDLAALLERHADALPAFFSEGGPGRVMPRYVRELADALQADRDAQVQELERLIASIDHIKNVVAVQLSYAGTSGAVEPGIITDLVEEALRLKAQTLEAAGVTVERDYGAVMPGAFDKPRLMQVLVNLVDNAAEAMESSAERRLQVVVRQREEEATVIVRDTGCGIAPEALAQVFAHGFTTKPRGHGFGLHSCALAAGEMGGSLTVASDGPGRGAVFTLRLPSGGSAPA